MKKKIFSAILVAAMATSMLAGCTNGTEGGDTGAQGGSTGSTQGGSTAVSADGVTTIEVYRATYNLSAVDDAQVQKVADAINAYLEEKGATVRINLHDIHNSEYGQKANLAFNNGEVDLLWNASWWGDGIGTNDIYGNKGAYDLTDIIAGSVLESSMDAGIWEASKYDGKIYFVPVYKEAYEGYDLKAPQAMVDKYGWDLSTVKELKDIEPMLAQLQADGVKQPYTTQTTAMFFRYGIDQFDFFTQTAGYGVDRKTNTVVSPIESEAYAEFCKLMGDWYAKGYISDDDLTKATPANICQTTDWGFTWWTCVPGDEGNSESRDLCDEAMIDGITGKYVHSTTTLGSCYTVSATCTEAEAKACVEFLGYLFTDSKLADLYTYGIEGEDYTIEDGKVAQNSDKYNHSAWESTSVKALSLTTADDDDKIAIYDSMNKAAATSCAAGFRFDKTPVAAEYAACDAIIQEYGYALENGAYPADKVDAVIAEYLEKLNAAGYQKVLDEFSAQYEAWKN